MKTLCLNHLTNRPDVSLSFQSASHSFTAWASCANEVNDTPDKVLRESNSSSGSYTSVLPLHQSTRPASLSWLSTTFRALSRDERGSYHITMLSFGFEPKPRYPRPMLPLHQLSKLREKGVANTRALEGLPCSHFLSHYRGLQSSAGNRDARPASLRWLLPIQKESRWPTQPPACFISDK